MMSENLFLEHNKKAFILINILSFIHYPTKKKKLNGKWPFLHFQINKWALEELVGRFWYPLVMPG